MKEETERHKLLVKRTVISLAAAIRVAAAGEKPKKKKNLTWGASRSASSNQLSEYYRSLYVFLWCLLVFLVGQKKPLFHFTFFLLLDIDIIYNWKCTVDLRNEPGSFGPLFFFSILRWPSQWISSHSVLIRKRIHNFFMSAMIMSYVVWSNQQSLSTSYETLLFFSSSNCRWDLISHPWIAAVFCTAHQSLCLIPDHLHWWH